MAELLLEQVSRVFSGAVRAVDRLDLEIQDQEFLVLVGPSGCGKSTTLRLIAGLDQPDSGQVRIGGQVVNDVPAWRRNVAMVFQHPALYPHLDVYGNIAFGLNSRERRGLWRRVAGLRHAGSLRQPAGAVGRDATAGLAESTGTAAEVVAAGAAAATRVAQVAEWLGVEQLLHRRPSELSGGQRQRVALGRAIVRRPEVFLLDEPLSNLDPAARVEMRRLLAQLHGRLPTTTCYVTHDQAEALTLGQRVAVMNAGRIEQVGTPRQVYERPRNRFVAGFIGSPPMSFLAGELEQSAGSWRFLGRGWALSVPAEIARKVADQAAGALLLGVRAENVVLLTDGGGKSGLGVVKSPTGVPARVMRTELLGGLQLVELQLEEDAQHLNGSGCVYMKVSAGLPVQPGDRANVTLDFESVHWFDRASGQSLLWDSSAAG